MVWRLTPHYQPCPPNLPRTHSTQQSSKQQQNRHLFASTSRGGDVKLWDVRSRGGAAAITLSSGGSDPLFALALAGGVPGGGLGGGSMVAFFGGAGESVWAFDLRGGQAQALYELSTGNQVMHGLIPQLETLQFYASLAVAVSSNANIFSHP